FMAALNKVVPSGLREVHVEIPRVKWEGVGGLEHVKRVLEEEVGWQFERPQDLREMGITPVKGIILYGPKGNGKTLLARALAGRYRTSFIAVRGPELLSKWVGESERRVREIFEKARRYAPSIIFFDEIDSIARPRGLSASSEVGDRIVGQLLVEMDGIIPMNGVLVLAATNRIDLVDPDLIRPGRFEKCIYIPPPDEEARRQILAIHLRGRPLDNDVDVEKLAELSDGFSGADISSWCNETAKLVLRKGSVRKLKMSDFLEALEHLKRYTLSNIDKNSKNHSFPSTIWR
ncbi:MAG: AAA family ATPase, partial [Candidatus Brockarchaeota archaeon]|nr:AAA family ATPase [Candidatus Brockarchaeota archaeon]